MDLNSLKCEECDYWKVFAFASAELVSTGVHQRHDKLSQMIKELYNLLFRQLAEVK